MSTTKPSAEAIDFVSYTSRGDFGIFSDCERIDRPSSHAHFIQSLLMRFRR